MKNYLKVGNDVYLGAQPDMVDLQNLKGRGVKTVIDLRPAAETGGANQQLVSEAGLNYVNIPVNKSALSMNSIDLLDAQLQRQEGPYLLHCATGTRGAVLLALRSAQSHGLSFDDSIAEIHRMGFDVSSSDEFLDIIRHVTTVNKVKADK